MRRGVTPLIALAFVIWIECISQTRFIARDEGFYLYAARAILDGQTPYMDFFLPQMPLMPYVYALWFFLTDVSWVAARFFSSIIALGCGYLVYTLARYLYGEDRARLSVILLGFCAAFCLWMPVAKNTGLATLLFLVGLYFSIVRSSDLRAGFFFGCAVLARLTFAPLALALLLPRKNTSFLGQVGAFALGLAPALLVSAYFYLSSPENFILDNYLYHLHRTRLGEGDLAENRHHVMLALLGVIDCVGGGGRQFIFLLATGALSAVCAGARSRGSLVLLTSAAVFLVANFAPSPTYVQYFSVVGVLLVPLAAHTLLTAREFIVRQGYYHLSSILVACSVFLFGWAGARDFRRFLISGEKVIGVGAPNHKAWRISSVVEIGIKIDEYNTARKPVYASWPGYLVGSESTAMPGAENNFGVGWANTMRASPQENRARKVAGRGEIIEAFQNGDIDLIVLFLGRGRRNELQESLESLHAVKVFARRGVVFYRRADS